MVCVAITSSSPCAPKVTQVPRTNPSAFTPIRFQSLMIHADVFRRAGILAAGWVDGFTAKKLRSSGNERSWKVHLIRDHSTAAAQ